jgi:hypothetical protein
VPADAGKALRSLPSGYAHEFGNVGPVSGAAQSASHNASSVVSAASAVAGELAGAGPLSADGVSGRLAKSATRWDTSIEPLGYVNRAGAVMG